VPIDLTGTEDDTDDTETALTAKEKAAARPLVGKTTGTTSPQQNRAEQARINGRKVKPAPTKVVSMTTVAQQQAEWIKKSPAEKAEWAQHLVDLGILSADQARDASTVAQSWTNYVESAADAYAAGLKISPWQAAEQDGDLIKAMGGPALGAGAGHPDGDVTQTGKTFDITNPTEARSKINTVFQQAFGRDAAPGELAALASSLQEAEFDSPVNTMQTDTYKGGAIVNSTAMKTGGMDSTQYLMEKAQKRPEYGAYQAATTYFNALIDAIGNPVSRG
jgi:hypothetical protein